MVISIFDKSICRFQVPVAYILVVNIRNGLKNGFNDKSRFAVSEPVLTFWLPKFVVHETFECSLFYQFHSKIKLIVEQNQVFDFDDVWVIELI